MKIAVHTTSEALTSKAQALAMQLHLPCINTIDETFSFILSVDPNGLSLIQAAKSSPGPIRIDFTKGKALHRRCMQQKELLAKAIGITSKYKPTVIDATAGFGTDTVVLASFGCQVIALERHPIVAALLQDAINRALNNTELNEITQKITLLHRDSFDYLESLTDNIEIVYLDPMFPVRKKSALVKKEMRALQQLLDDKEDASALLKIAIKKAKKRVIVKRPRLAPFLANLKPDFQIKGKSVRFDVYQPRH